MRFSSLLILSLLLLSTMTNVAQNDDSFYTDTLTGVHYDFYKIIEVAPQFPGGEDSLNHFLLSQIVYPKEAQDNQIQGTVYVGFTINEDGSVSDVRIMRSVGAGLDEEAMRVISLMPNWIPAQNKGKPIRVDMCLPVRFIMN